MKAYDFEFDGQLLSSFGMVLCNFDSKGMETISNGSEIVFNTVSTLNGSKLELTSAIYEDSLEATFQICKKSCSGDLEITPIEFRELTKWLNRKKFLKFKILDDFYWDLYYEASFISISRIEMGGKLYGLELTVRTNAPFAFKEPRIINIENTEENGIHSVNDSSHEEGYIYPYTEITILEDGNLNIYNALEDRDTYIENCVAGEVIAMDYPVISSSDETHNKTIQDDFNWNFFRIANTYKNTRNDLTISIPCKIKLKYSPIVKVGL